MASKKGVDAGCTSWPVHPCFRVADAHGSQFIAHAVPPSSATHALSPYPPGSELGLWKGSSAGPATTKSSWWDRAPVGPGQ